MSIRPLGDADVTANSFGWFQVTREGSLDQELTVEYEITGSARNGRDYQRLPGCVTFPAGVSSVSVPVIPIPRLSAEPSATVTLTLASRLRPFSIVVLPDTQFYTGIKFGGTPDMFTWQTQWIVDHKDDLNIAFVLHEGDMTELNARAEWERGRASMALLDSVLPYAVALGNHDGFRSPALFNEFFSYGDFSQRPEFGGAFQSNRMDNCYQLFSAGGIDWLVLTLEYGPRNVVLDWANGVMSSYPDRKAILLTHAHVFSNDVLLGTSPGLLGDPIQDQRENSGIDVWNKLLRRQPNSAFAFSGHVFSPLVGRVVGTGDAGNKVIQMLVDFQGLWYGGAGYLWLVRFFPEEDKMTVRTYSPFLDQWRTNAGYEFECPNLGIFTNLTTSYATEGTPPSASLTILNQGFDGHLPEMSLVRSWGVPPQITLSSDVSLDTASAQAVANYSFEDGSRVSKAVLCPDRRNVTLTTAAVWPDRSRHVLTVQRLRAFTGGWLEVSQPAQLAFVHRNALMAEDFADLSLARWILADDPGVDQPSRWVPRLGRLFQLSHTYARSAPGQGRHGGTSAVWRDPAARNWTNYCFEVGYRTFDYGGLGAYFRYLNPSNFYKLELESSARRRTLYRVQNGAEAVLAAETGVVGYATGQDENLRVELVGGEMLLKLNDVILFGGPVTDTNLPAGTVGVLSFANERVAFSNLTVTPVLSSPRVRITKPAAGSTLNQLPGIPIQIEASDPDSSIARVEVFAGTDRIATLLQPPYEFNWKTAPVGSVGLSARAVDTKGLASICPTNYIVVNAGMGVVLISEPQSEAVDDNDGVLLNALADGTGPLAYQWLDNGQPIAGATNTLFFVDYLSASEAHDYQVVVSNMLGSVTSRLANVTVKANTNSLSGPFGPRISLRGMDQARTMVFQVEKDPQMATVVETSTRLDSIWHPLLVISNHARKYYFSDPIGATSAVRFYRAVPLP